MPAGEEFARRRSPGAALAESAPAIAGAARAMAGCFRAGATLVAFGSGAAAADATHVAVEFVHPVIVGKRALPALSLANDVATITALGADGALDDVFAHQLRHLARPGDVALGVSPDGNCATVVRGLETAADLGLLTVALTGGASGALARRAAVDHLLVAPADEPLVVKELQVTTYHVLWELVHVFLDQPASSTGANATLCHGDHCVTCSDEAVEVLVVELRPGALAVVDTGGALEEVSVALVDARIGSRVLVHAGEAIGVVEPGEFPA